MKKESYVKTLSFLFTLLLLVSLLSIFSISSVGVDTTTLQSSPEVEHIVELIVIPGYSSHNDFTGYTNRATIGVCSCSSFSDVINFRNTGTSSSQFTVKKAGSAAKFVNYVPNLFSLDPSESTEINLVGSIPCSTAPGLYDLETHFEDLVGKKRCCLNKLEFLNVILSKHMLFILVIKIILVLLLFMT